MAKFDPKDVQLRTVGGKTVIYEPGSKGRGFSITSSRGEKLLRSYGLSPRDVSGKQTVGFGGKKLETPDQISIGKVGSNVFSQERLAEDRREFLQGTFKEKKKQRVRGLIDRFVGNRKPGEELSSLGGRPGRKSTSLVSPVERAGLGAVGSTTGGGRFTTGGDVIAPEGTTIPAAETTSADLGVNLVAPTEENAEALVSAGMAETADVVEEEFGDRPPGDIDALFAQQRERQEQARGFFEGSAERTERIADIEAQQQREQLGAQFEAFASQVTPTRGGPSSASNVSAVARAQEALSQRVETLNLRRQNIASEIEQRRAALQQAQQDNNVQLVEQIQNAITAKQVELQEAETSYINSLTAASQEERLQAAADRESLSSFTQLVGQGTELSTEAIMTFADKLGIDFKAAYDYYQGAQAIRDDKSLTNEEKEIANAQALQDLTDQVNRVETSAAKNVEYLRSLYAQGADQETIDAFKDAAGITNANDPFYQADLAVRQAEATIKEKQANGEPVTQSDWSTYWDNIQKQNEVINSGGEAYVPKESLEGIQSSYSGGKLNIATDTPYQCGEFVNRFWGLSSGGSGGFGNSYASKQKIVDTKGIGIGDVNMNNYLSVLKPGMAFVSSSGGQYGHVGIVTQVLPDGRFRTMEANIGDNNVNTPDVPIESVRNIKDADLYGFAPPPNYDVVGGGEAAEQTGLYGQFLQEAIDQGLEGEKAQEFAEKRLDESYKPMTESQSSSFNAYQATVTENEEYKSLVKDVNLESFADSINVITKKAKEDGLTAELINRNIDDPTIRRALLSEMRWIEAKLRKESGAAISVQEYQTVGTSFFPRAGDDEETIKVKQQRREQAADSFYAQMGPAGQRAAVEAGIGVSETQDDENFFGDIDVSTGEDILNELNF